MNLFIKIFIYTVILLFLLKLFLKSVIDKEGFYPFGPWWQPTRSTRNMSYDLRGDVPINNGYIGPYKQGLWRNISSYFPIQNKPLWMVS